MSPVEFLPYLLDNLSIYFIVFLSFSLPYFILLRKLTFNFFDPFFLILVGSFFSSIIVVFLFAVNLIELKYLYYYIYSEILFTIGLFCFFINKKKLFYKLSVNVIRRDDSLDIIKALLLVSSILYFLSISLDYFLNGIPLFRQSYIGAYVGSGGFGIIERFKDVSLGVLILSSLTLLLTKRSFNNKKLFKFFTYIILIITIITFVLSGSKSKILIFGFAWVYIIYYWFSGKYYLNIPSMFVNKKGVLFLGLAICSSLVAVTYHAGTDSLLKSLGALLFRFVNYGDVFLYAYVGDHINDLKGDNPFIGLFGGFLSVFRILSPQDLYVPVGIQLPRIIYPGLDYIAGPNARQNVVGLHFFGWYLGGVFSFLLGFIISFVRYKLCFILNDGYFKFTIYFLLSRALLTLHVDFDFALSKLASVIIVFPIIWCLSKMLIIKKG